ncbi:MAG: PNGase F N-terminal domain-containing protein [Ignavibacteria bacterium]
MLKYYIVLLLITIPVFSQPSARITYNFYSNGSPNGTPPLILDATDKLSKYITASGEEFYFDYLNNTTYQTTLLKSGERIVNSQNIDSLPKPELLADTMTILGYLCNKAHVVIRSNHIDIWYTTETKVKGTPSINIGPALGLVLKIVRNGNFEISASDIEPVSFEPGNNYLNGEFVDLPLYRDMVTAQNYTTIQIFNKEKINYGDTIINLFTNEPGITYRFSEGTVILKKIHLPDNMGKNTVVAELTERSSGDAYDRNGSCFIIPAGVSDTSLTFIDGFINGIKTLPVYPSSDSKKYNGFTLTEKYTPPIELMRFITPFGINYYNSQMQVHGVKWEDSVTYKQDVTNLLPVLQGEVWFGVFIGCYDNGGHNVSLRLKYFPDDVPMEPVAVNQEWIAPIIFTTNIMEASGQEYATIFGSDTLNVTVDIPEGLSSLTMRYISTGHGGWENGDEFNKKLNQIFIDAKQVYSFIPWRDDCGMYRRYNPASGNFPNGMSSSDFSRSGWCPGSTSIPVDIPLTGLKPGRHTFSVYIPMGKPEGTSQSAWNISAVLIGKY